MRYPRFALVAVLALVSVPTAWGQPQAELVLHFVEIGQGDCTLIECPNGGGQTENLAMMPAAERESS